MIQIFASKLWRPCAVLLLWITLTTASFAQPFRLAAPIIGNPKAAGWQVGPALGGLQFSVPIGRVPGEVPIPVSMTMGGTFEAYQMWTSQNNAYFLQLMDVPIFGTCGFGYIGYSGGATMQAAGRYIATEEGKTYLTTEFSSKPHGSSLLGAWSYSPSPAYQVHSMGQLLWAKPTAAQGASLPFKHGSLVQQNLPTGFTFNLISQQFGPPLMQYDVVADKDRIRIYVEVLLGGQSVGLPVLWADRFGHYVTFKWTQVGSGLPAGITSIVRVDARNQRNQGVTLRYANWSDTTVVHDLMRVDFVNLSGPAALIQGYSGFSTKEPTGFSSPSTHPSLIVSNAIGGMIARPTIQTIGDPLTVPQPSWNNSGSPAGTAPPLPASNSGVASRVWQIQYDSNLAEVVNFTDPMSVRANFSYATHSLMRSPADNVPILLRGVTQAVETDFSQATPPTRTSTWSRSLPTSGSQSWTVTAQNWWSSVGASDSTLIYTFAPMSNTTSLDYSNAFLQSLVLVDNATGLTRHTTTYTSTTTTSGTVGGGLDNTLSIQASMTDSRWLENPRQVSFAYTDSSALQASTITNQVDVGGTYRTFQTKSFQYNDKWAMLEANQVKQVLVTRYDPISGTALTPTTTTTNVWDSGAALQLQQTYLDAGATLRHGQSFTYDTTSTNSTYGKLLTQAILHNEYSSTPSPSPATSTLGYDVATGLQSSWTTSYLDIPSGTGTVSRTAGNFDGAARPQTITDERQTSTTLAYDLFDRKTQITPAGETPLNISYPDLWTTTETRGTMSKTMITDGFGRSVRQNLPDGTYLTYTYDLHGRQASTSKHGASSHVLTTSVTYDLLGRTSSLVQYDGKITTFTYALASNGNDQVTQTLGSSSKVSLTNPFGQTVSVRLPSGDLTTYSFNGMGKLTKVLVTPQNGAPVQERSFSWDNLGRLTSKIAPETGTQSINSFNALNSPTSITEAGSRSRSLVYDGLSRARTISSSISGTSAVLNYTYSGAFLTTASSSVNSDVVRQDYGYYAASSGAHLQTETTIQGGLTSSISYTYTGLGDIDTITYPSTRVVTYGRDSLARVTGISSNVNGTIVSNVPNQFDEWGNRQLLQFNSGARDTWAVDPNNMAQLKTLSIIPVGGGGPTWTYSYDAGTGWLNGTGEWSLPPDANGRLSQASGNGFTTTLQYDGYGNNNSSVSAGSVPSAMNNFIINATAAPMTQNRLLSQVSAGGSTPFSVVYDAYGEITTIDTGVGTGDWLTVTWDPLGRLSSAWQRSSGATESFRYAPSGLMVTRTDNVNSSKNRFYAYSQGGTLYSSFLGNGAWDRDVIYLEGRAVAEIDGNGVHELHSDHLGSPRIITNGATGLVEGSQTFGPFGELITYSGSYSPANGLPLTGYTGHLQAEPNGLIYMRGRFYSPAWHCFLNSDQGADTKQLNQFAYTSGNPFTAVDPSGMSWLGDKLGDLWKGVSSIGRFAIGAFINGGAGSYQQTFSEMTANYYNGQNRAPNLQQSTSAQTNQSGFRDDGSSISVSGAQAWNDYTQSWEDAALPGASQTNFLDSTNIGITFGAAVDLGFLRKQRSAVISGTWWGEKGFFTATTGGTNAKSYNSDDFTLGAAANLGPSVVFSNALEPSPMEGWANSFNLNGFGVGLSFSYATNGAWTFSAGTSMGFSYSQYSTNTIQVFK